MVIIKIEIRRIVKAIISPELIPFKSFLTCLIVRKKREKISSWII